MVTSDLIVYQEFQYGPEEVKIHHVPERTTSISHRNRTYSRCCFPLRSVSLSKSLGRNITEELGWLVAWMRRAVGVFTAKGRGRRGFWEREVGLGIRLFLCWGLAEARGEQCGMKKRSAMMGDVPRLDGSQV